MILGYMRKKLFLSSISLCMRIYKHLKLLLFFVGISYVHFTRIAFYDRNNYKTKKQPYNWQITIHRGEARHSIKDY